MSFTDYAITFKREPLRLFIRLGYKDNRFAFQTIPRKNLNQYKKSFFSFKTFHDISGDSDFYSFHLQRDFSRELLDHHDMHIGGICSLATCYFYVCECMILCV